ncbi:hypothetical protein BDA99DRAFT_562450 [Phascolomyces articulosus]|uniref:Midasin n=1 Tax=Phascolomyces articulosus TaxID=60185 RepID=A0AAD5K4U2_9FUNG|nr:hypothetical protein BDA99DRAFT_562450 [Phascolomyces articulosus]
MKLLGTAIITGGALVCASGASIHPSYGKREEAVKVYEDVTEPPFVAGIIGKEEQLQVENSKDNQVIQEDSQDEEQETDIQEDSQKDTLEDDLQNESQEDTQEIEIQKNSREDNSATGDGLMQFDGDAIFEDDEEEEDDEEDDEMDVLDDDNNEEGVLKNKQGQVKIMSSDHHHDEEEEEEEEEDDDDHEGRNKQQFGGFWSSPQDFEKDIPEKAVDQKEEKKGSNKKEQHTNNGDNYKDKQLHHDDEIKSVPLPNYQGQKHDEQEDVSSMNTETARVNNEDLEKENTMVKSASILPSDATSPVVLETHTIHSASSLPTPVFNAASVSTSNGNSVSHPSATSSIHSASNASTVASEASMLNQLFTLPTLLAITGALVWFLA